MGGSPSCQVPAVDMKGPIADEVKEQINSNCVMIFSKTYCPYCKMAKKAFDDIGARQASQRVSNSRRFRHNDWSKNCSTGICFRKMHWWRLRSTTNAERWLSFRTS